MTRARVVADFGDSTFSAANASSVPLTIQGYASQTANLINATDSSNNFLFSIVPTGRIDLNTVGTFLFQGTAYRASNPASIVGRRSRSDTFGVNAALQINDGVTNIQAQANDGTSFLQSSAIFFEIDGAVSTNIVPGRIVLSTASIAGSGMAERLRIDSSGSTKFSSQIIESATVSATAATGTINYDLITNKNILYYTSAATGNFTINVRGSSTITLNSMMDVGQSLTVVFMNTNTGTAYYHTGFQVDGVSVTPKWQGGTAPSAGNTNSIDIYSYTIIKTAATPTYTVLASQTKFA